jgi:hypothetical protein
MRVLQVCSARSIGGGERHVIDLSNQLTIRGHEVFLALVAESPLVSQLEQVPSDRIATFHCETRSTFQVPCGSPAS